MHRIIENEPFAKHTSWRIGGPARYYCEATDLDELRAALTWAHERDLPIFLLGNGTNLLVRESGFPGLVVRYIARDWHITADEDNEHGLLVAQAGMPMAGLARRVSALGWSGLEWAEGLPGSVGGALYGNAGCYGGDIASMLEHAWLLLDDDVQFWSVEQLHYGYRTSVLKASQQQSSHQEKILHELADQPDLPAPNVSTPGNGQQPSAPNPGPIILAAELRVVRAEASKLAAKIAHISAERKRKTPWGRSCGSVFKNPPATATRPAMSAGQLIDQAGLKGERVGDAQISPLHANYIVNLGQATSKDVLKLVEIARSTVLRESGIELELEVQLL